jgi:hypothetical protein
MSSPFPNQRRHSGSSVEAALFLNITCGKKRANAPIFIYLVISDKNNTYKTFVRAKDLLSYRIQTTSGFCFHFFYFHQDSRSKVIAEGTFLYVSDIREAE